MSRKSCKETVMPGWESRPCSRKAWRDGYCKQHHPDTKAARDRKAQECWDAELATDAARRLERDREVAARFLDAAERQLQPLHGSILATALPSLRDFLQTWDGGK